MMEDTMALTLSSPAFQRQSSIPARYTCNGANISPPLQWEGAPWGTQTFALLCEDPDVPRTLKPDGMYDHWVLFNIPASETELPENMQALPSGAVQGKNASGGLGYTGPCPPDRQHRYFFKLFALDTTLGLTEGATKADVITAMQGHVLAEAELMGVYDQPR